MLPIEIKELKQKAIAVNNLRTQVRAEEDKLLGEVKTLLDKQKDRKSKLSIVNKIYRGGVEEMQKFYFTNTYLNKY